MFSGHMIDFTLLHFHTFTSKAENIKHRGAPLLKNYKILQFYIDQCNFIKYHRDIKTIKQIS